MKILIIEDEYALADTISDALILEKFDVKIENDGETGETEALTGIYDLILLDVMLPHKDGFSILKSIKEKINTPVIMLTAKSEITDKLEGLENGADDYITKPFHLKELLARIKIVLKRNNKIDDIKLLHFEDLQLDTENSKILTNNNEIEISFKEEKLLECLMINKSKITSRDYLVEKIWGYDDNSEYNNVEVYVSFLRKKLKLIDSKVNVKYIKSKGYKLVYENDKPVQETFEKKNTMG